jgi:hypothetical protein
LGTAGCDRYVSTLTDRDVANIGRSVKFLTAPLIVVAANVDHLTDVSGGLCRPGLLAWLVPPASVVEEANRSVTMNQNTSARHRNAGPRSDSADARIRPPGFLGRNVPGTGMPVWLLAGLVALGLPRTILADLGIVEPESSWVYFVLALTPFAVWLAVAVLRGTDSPITDHLVVGTCYGLSLVIVHEALWKIAAPLGNHPPQSAVDFATRFDPALQNVALHAYTFVIAMMIGLSSGLVIGVVAAVAKRVRASYAR